MHRKELKEQVIRQHGSVEHSLRAFMKKGDQKDLHRYRTGVKKLRALAALVEHTAPVVHLHTTLQPIKKTFKSSGVIRDAHQYLELGKQEQADPTDLAEKKTQMKKDAKTFRAARRKHIQQLKRAKGALIKKLQPVKNHKLNRFYNDELLAIAAELQIGRNDEELHESRKRLKILLYDLPVVRRVLTLQINEGYLEQVQTAIGDWHDNLLASENFPALKKKTKKLRQEINELTSNFYERATTPVTLPLQQID